ncbi:hypothetical protein ACS0TY_003114 [Phlomoides rotata]
MRWHPPLQGCVKLNVDASFFEDSLEMGLGVIIHDVVGAFVSCRSLVIPRVYRIDEGEAMGHLEALSWIKQLGLLSVKIEMEGKLITDAINDTRVETLFSMILYVLAKVN